HVALDGEYAGCIVISDALKPESPGIVPALKSRGVRKTVMLSGDSAQNAAAVAETLGIDEVYAQLLPHEKVEKLEALVQTKRPGGKLAFVGDGINDAPVLARADIGVAMGRLGADAAIEAADVVLMNDDPLKLAEAVDISRATKRIVWQNIVFALGVKGAFLLLGAFGAVSLPEAVFADVGVALLAIFNSMRILTKK
ncbi:MAG: HAD-IC family P-type ATPase, partial [Clostridiales bacterium]|nr:HAD-IC family P-type ATPase [Clostridiales bacterium]